MGSLKVESMAERKAVTRALLRVEMRAVVISTQAIWWLRGSILSMNI